MKKSFQDFIRETGLSSVQLCNLAVLPYHTAKSVITGRDLNPSLVTRYRLALVTGLGYSDLTPIDIVSYEDQKRKNAIWQQAEAVAIWLVERWREQGVLPEGREALNANANDASQNMPSYLLYMYPKVSKTDGLQGIEKAVAGGGVVLDEKAVQTIQAAASDFVKQLTVLLSANEADLNRVKRLLTSDLSQVANLLNIVADSNPHQALQRQIKFQKQIFNKS